MKDPGQHYLTGCIPPLEILQRLACPRCRVGIEHSEDMLRCPVCDRTFPADLGILRMLPEAERRDADGSRDGFPDPAAGSGAKEKPLDYEGRRFGSKHGRRRNAFERSTVDRFLSRYPSGLWVLDVPCGMGRFNGQIICHGNKALSVDRDLGRVSYALSRTAFPSTAAIQGDAFSLPLRDGSIDIALCIRLTHHLDEERLFHLLAELGRVAREILITYYNSWTFRTWWRRFKKAVRGDEQVYSCSLPRLSRIAGAAGLRVIGHVPKPGVLHHPIQFLHLGRTLQMPICAW